ncbi:hypothetical protein ASG21_15265 [Chryseobacterium sp. Leaf394]|nr:hypothetical protein ASG21_15265 [Chryseobacterium sp. Leaf394]
MRKFPAPVIRFPVKKCGDAQNFQRKSPTVRQDKKLSELTFFLFFLPYKCRRFHKDLIQYKYVI